MTREEIIKVLGIETTRVIEAYLKASSMHGCRWMDTDGIWWTSCGLTWTFEDAGSPNSHGVIHCPRCGGRVEAVDV